MNVLLIGGSGVLGRSFCRQAQHSKTLAITALVRSGEKAESLQRFGVKTVQGDIFDIESIRRNLESQHAILNFSSSIPRKLKPSVRDWEPNDRIRTTGTENILQCLTQGNYFYCQAGFVFLHGDHGGDWVTENSPVNPSAYTQSSLEMEKQFLEAVNPSLRGVSFRFSLFYHQDAWHTQAMLRELRKRRFPIIGDGDYYWNMIHVDDAAAAVLRTLERQNEINGREVMIVSDDEPVTCRDFLHHLARLLGVPEPTKIPQFVAKLALSGDAVEVLTASFRCRNDKIKKLGWKPVYRSFREGFPAVLQFI